MKTVLVIRANRGIGLQLIRTFAKNGWDTIGSVRPETLNTKDPSIADASKIAVSPYLSYKILQPEATNAKIVEIDCKNESTIKKAADELRDTKLDVLINCAAKCCDSKARY
ncbi:hypothetical protein B0O99DRAFT_602428 [Bisporella sp. PMI_857]|nr:hypothetical protein B0O99DRAFT_602428 [Bisporella sp. PMI_857]